MCIIIEKPAGIKLDPDIYEECFRMHGDGVGIAYVNEDKNQLVIEKGFMNKKDAIKAILELEELHLLIHFRKVSRGPVNAENCHPFWAESDEALPLPDGADASEEEPRFQFAVAHNGTFNINPSEGKSDTFTIMCQVIGPWLARDPRLFENQYSRFIWEGYCDKGFGMKNKVVVFRYDRLTKQLSVEFLFKKEGMTYMGCWFSNYSWVPMGSKWSSVRPTNSATTTNHYYGGCGAHNKPATADATGGGVNNNFRHDDFSIAGVPHLADPGWGEQYPDHLGWTWHRATSKFYNIHTGGSLPELTYRKANDDDYVYQSKAMKRTSNHSISEVLEQRRAAAQKKTEESSGVSQQSRQLSLATETNPVRDANKGITVPRDPDLNEADAWERSINLAKGLQDGNIDHLSKKDKRRLIRLAEDFVKECYGDDIKRDCPPKMCVAIMRNEFIGVFSFASDWSIAQIDQHIIGRGGFTVDDMKRGLTSGNYDEPQGDFMHQGGIGHN